MGLIDRLVNWVTLPAVETGTFRCMDCRTAIEAAEAACPECGGDVEKIVPEPIELYWPHH